MKRFLCLFSVFLAITSQMLFLSESNVIYANTISLFVIPFFILTIYNWKIKFSLQIKIITFMLFYFLIAYFWSDSKLLVTLDDFKTLFLTLIFLICIYNILIKYRTILPVLIAFWFITFFNFLIFINIIPQELFFELEYWEVRFYGTFNNANIGAISFSFSLFFADYFLMQNKKNNRFLKVVIILIMIISAILVIATGSKKGIILIMLFLIYKAYMFTTSGFKNIFLMLMLMVFGLQFIDLQLIDEYFNTSLFRIDQFINEIEYNSGKDGSTSERLFFIKKGLSGFFDSPLLGNGFKSFEFKYGNYSHNNYIELLYSGGLILFFSYYLIYYNLFKLSLNSNIRAIKVFTFISILSLLMIDLAAVSYVEKNIHYIICSLFVINYPDQ